MTAAIVLVCVIAAFLLLCFGIAVYLFNSSVVRKKKYPSVPIGSKEEVSELRRTITDGIRWFEAKGGEKLEITSFDGLKLRGKYLANGSSSKTMVFVHGYTSNGLRDFARAAHIAYNEGFNVLVYDQRSAGESEGRFTTFGINERHDCLRWVKTVLQRYGKKDIYLVGVSMGAATVLMTLAEKDLPPEVKGVIADCGYTSPYAEFKYQLSSLYHIPPYPVLWFASLLCKRVAHFSTSELSTLKAVAHTSVPVFFAHGTADSFVPCEMTEMAYAACASKKELHLVAGAAHFNSFSTDTELYINKVKKFFEF